MGSAITYFKNKNYMVKRVGGVKVEGNPENIPSNSTTKIAESHMHSDTYASLCRASNVVSIPRNALRYIWVNLHIRVS